jgi:hypothetical protein
VPVPVAAVPTPISQNGVPLAVVRIVPVGTETVPVAVDPPNSARPTRSAEIRFRSPRTVTLPVATAPPS